MAVFDMYMSIRVHVRSWSTAPLISGFTVTLNVLKAKAENYFWYGQFGLDKYLARENQNRKKEKSNTRASENRLYRSRIAGNFDTAKSQGATTARTRADGSSLLSKKWASWTSGGSRGNGKNKNAPIEK